jgi:hypothetical protein
VNNPSEATGQIRSATIFSQNATQDVVICTLPSESAASEGMAKGANTLQHSGFVVRL